MRRGTRDVACMPWSRSNQQVDVIIAMHGGVGNRHVVEHVLKQHTLTRRIAARPLMRRHHWR
jgi:hypothetical protein